MKQRNQKTEEEMEEIKRKQMELLESISGFLKTKHMTNYTKSKSEMDIEIASYIKEKEIETKLK